VLKAESNLSEVTDRAAALLEQLRSRLSAEPPPAEAPAQQEVLADTYDDLDRELQAYFAAGSDRPTRSVLNEIRDRVIEGVVDRIIQSWDQPRGSRSEAIEEAVVDRLIERVLERARKGS
jgi:hypothetical protein